MPSHIPDQMQAVRCHGPKDYRLVNLPVPYPGPGEVLVRVDACGICASDVKCYDGAPLFWGDEHRTAYVQAPVTAGHEFIGTVVALGDGAEQRTGLTLGMRAIAEQIVPCTKCRYCKSGKYWLCNVNDIFGFHQAVQGGMADYMLFPSKSICYSVPSALPVQLAALIEPLACSMHAVDRAEIAQNDVVVIAGCGTLGLGMVAIAHLLKPATLVAIDRQPDRLSVAKQFGADVMLNPDECDVEAQVRDLTGGYGCDVFIEATGNPAAVNPGLRMVSKGGTFVEFSVMRGETSTDWTIIGDSKELNIRGAHLGPGCYPRVIELLSSGALRVEPMITHQLPLDQYHQGIEMVHDADRSIKVLLVPGGSLHAGRGAA